MKASMSSDPLYQSSSESESESDLSSITSLAISLRSFLLYLDIYGRRRNAATPCCKIDPSNSFSTYDPPSVLLHTSYGPKYLGLVFLLSRTSTSEFRTNTSSPGL